MTQWSRHQFIQFATAETAAGVAGYGNLSLTDSTENSPRSSGDDTRLEQSESSSGSISGKSFNLLMTKLQTRR